MFPLSPLYRNLAIAVGVILLLAGVYAKGRLDEKVLFDAYKREVASAAKAQEARNESVQKQQDLLNKGVIDGYKAKLAAANSYINSLRYDPGSGKLSTASGTAGGTDGGAQDDIPPTPILAADCAATTVQLIQLQQWAKGQVSIK